MLQMMINRQKIVASALFLLAAQLLTGCAVMQAPENEQTRTPQTNVDVVTATSAAATPAQPENVSTQIAPIDKIILWLPPQFDPSAAPQGTLLQAQIDTFLQAHPGLIVDIHIKDMSETASLLVSLERTLRIAPAAAPSLILMPQKDLVTAAGKDLLQLPDRLHTLMEDEDWYGYARELSTVQNEVYGIPFAADALIVASKIRGDDAADAGWEGVLDPAHPLLFPVADEQALFTINLYISAGGRFFNEHNQPELNMLVFQQVLEFYDAAAENGSIMTSAETMTYAQTWDRFERGLADQTVTWASSYLDQSNSRNYGRTIPSLGNEPATLVSGWVWTVSDPYPERHELDLEILRALTDAGFQSIWSEMAGYLPVRPSSLMNWNNANQSMLLSQTVITAVNQPGSDILQLFGPVMAEAVYNVIIKQASPAEAARLAAETINPE